MHVFPAYWAIVFVFIPQTIVRVEGVNVDAHGTLIAVTILLRTADTAEPAFIAVKRFLT